MANIVWSVVTGCHRVSEGCYSCPSYWEHFEEGKDYSPITHEDVLEKPMNNPVPSEYLVAAGSDLFHADVELGFLTKVFDVMNRCRHHTFQIVTKRSNGALLISNHFDWSENIHMGVAVESAEYKYRITDLQKIPAQVRCVSMVPVLGPMGALDLQGIDYLTAVRETWGFKRPAKQIWIDEIKQQCEMQNVLFSTDYVLYEKGSVKWQEHY